MDDLGPEPFQQRFIAANFQMAENPKFATIGNALVRFEFWEYLVRIASFKYREAVKSTLTCSQAFEKLIIEKLIPSKPEPWQGFRDKQLWTIDVNDMLEANLQNLQKIFSNYFTPIKKHIVCDDVVDMIVRVGDLKVSEVDVIFSFGMSNMAVTNEPA